MSISLEALAMAGADYLKDGMSFEEFERHEAELPPYLFADEDENENLFFNNNINNYVSIPNRLGSEDKRQFAQK